MPAVRPFPWRAVEKTTHADAALLGAVRRWADRRWPLASLRDAFRAMLGVPVEVIVRRAKPLASAGEFGEGLAILCASGDLAPAGDRVLLAVERALAADLVARALRRPAPAIAAVSEAAAGRSASLAGALAAVLVAAARRALPPLTNGPRATGPLHVLAAGDATGPAGDALGIEPDAAIAIALTVVVGDNAYSARATLARPLVEATPGRAWTRASLTALGRARLALPVVAATVETSALDVAALRRGDVFVPGAIAIAKSRSGLWTGSVSLVAPGGEAAVSAELAEGERLVLRAESGGTAEPAEGLMTDDEASAGLVEALGDVPVIVRVEIGRAEMPARDWATLGEGDVIALGQPVGQAVLLRVGSHPVARGELVDVEGEVGVRILEKFASSVTATGDEPTPS